MGFVFKLLFFVIFSWSPTPSLSVKPWVWPRMAFSPRSPHIRPDGVRGPRGAFAKFSRPNAMGELLKCSLYVQFLLPRRPLYGASLWPTAPCGRQAGRLANGSPPCSKKDRSVRYRHTLASRFLHRTVSEKTTSTTATASSPLPNVKE